MHRLVTDPHDINIYSNFNTVGCIIHTYQYMLCIVAIIFCKHLQNVVQNNRNIPYRVAIVYHTHIGSFTASFMDLVTFYGGSRHFDRGLLPPLGLATVVQEQELHKPNSINTCYVLLLLLTLPMHTMLSKISENSIQCCYY